jgi:hypothetical protein
MMTPAQATSVSMATFSVLETLILELGARNIVESETLVDILEDAALSHEQIARENGEQSFLHLEAAKLIRSIIRQVHHLP